MVKKQKAIFYIIPALIIFFVLAVDQFTKYIFQNKYFVVIKGILEIKYSQNPGIVFGWFSGNLFVVALLPLLIICLFGYMYFREANNHKLLMIGIPLVIAGLLGNLIDRFTRGFVTDFILVPIKPEQNISNFNVADASLISGVVLILIYLIWFEAKENKNKEQKKIKKRSKK